MAHPWISRRVVYPLHERLLKRPTFAYLDSLEQSQWLSRAALERMQMQNLTELLETAARHSPWHAERMSAAGLDFDDGGAPLTLRARTSIAYAGPACPAAPLDTTREARAASR
jgi:phenylacetate-CoA ligase